MAHAGEQSRLGDDLFAQVERVNAALWAAQAAAQHDRDFRAVVGALKVLGDHVKLLVDIAKHVEERADKERRESREHMLAVLAKELGLDPEALLAEYERLEKLL